MKKINCPTLLTLFIPTIFLVILYATPSFATTPHSHEWTADSQTRGGKTVSCFIKLDTASLDWMTTDPKALSSTVLRTALTLMLIEKSNRKLLAFTVKVTGTRILEDLTTHAIPIHFAWVQSSTGSTTTQLTQAETAPEKYYLGMLAGMDGLDLFTKIFKGVVEDGLVVGWQESPGDLDKVLKVKDGLPKDKQISFLSCFEQLTKELLAP